MSPITAADQATRWYALYVRSRQEKLVSAMLQGRGYEEFLPLYRARRQWSDRIMELDLPLFPGYVFCRFDVCRRLPILTIPAVVEIVGTGKLPAPVSDHEMDAIRSIVDSGLAAEPWPYLKIGNLVRVQHGALSGLEGILIQVKTRYRLVVSLTLLQRSVAVEIDSAWVRPVWSARPVTIQAGQRPA